MNGREETRMAKGKKKLERIGLTYVYCNQKKRDNSTETIEVVEETCNYVERQNLLTSFFLYKLN
jgi:hypothetical protein